MAGYILTNRFLLRLTLGTGLLALFTACAVSPETQAKIDQYNRTIVVCRSDSDCDSKWQAARRWALQHSDFPIFTESDTRIMASSTLTTNSGVGIVVRRVAVEEGYQLLVDVDCFSAFGCPQEWDLRLDFNQVVGAAGR